MQVLSKWVLFPLPLYVLFTGRALLFPHASWLIKMVDMCTSFENGKRPTSQALSTICNAVPACYVCSHPKPVIEEEYLPLVIPLLFIRHLASSPDNVALVCWLATSPHHPNTYILLIANQFSQLSIRKSPLYYKWLPRRSNWVPVQGEFHFTAVKRSSSCSRILSRSLPLCQPLHLESITIARASRFFQTRS